MQPKQKYIAFGLTSFSYIGSEQWNDIPIHNEQFVDVGGHMWLQMSHLLTDIPLIEMWIACLYFIISHMAAMTSQITAKSTVGSTVSLTNIKDSNKTCVTGLLERNLQLSGGFIKASKAENDSILWRHHVT